MHRDCILFDMDGVLIDSEYCMRLSSILALKEYGIEATHEDFMEFTGMGEERFIGGVVEKYGKPYSAEMKARAYAIYDQIAEDNVILYEGIHQLVLRLKELGYKVAVGSAADLTKVKINLRCIGLTPKDFDALVTGSDIVRKKPDPEIFLTAASRIGATPDRCIVVEDAVSGVQAAKAAGMLAIGVTGTFDSATLRAAGADYTVEKTQQMLEIIKDL